MPVQVTFLAQARPYMIARSWSEYLLDEFFTQGDLERRLGYPVFPAADRNSINHAKSQTDFIDTFGMPLFKVVSRTVPGKSMASEFSFRLF